VDQKPLEIWFQDEARVGQKTKLTRRWAKRGTRPSAPKDQRTTSVWLFGAICPDNGKAAGLVMPWANSHAMAAHLKVISAAISDDAHGVLVLDQAGWHTAGTLAIPANITLLPLPPRSPELNPVENVRLRRGPPAFDGGIGLLGFPYGDLTDYGFVIGRLCAAIGCC
jgi:hypothetical protein